MKKIHAGMVQEGQILAYTDAVMKYFMPFIEIISNITFVTYIKEAAELYFENGTLKDVKTLKEDFNGTIPELDMVIHPVSVQDIANYKGWIPTNTFVETDVIIFSAAPTASDSYSFDFITNSQPVFELLFGCSFLVALVMTNWRQRSPVKVFIEMMIHVWNLIFIYFFEPISEPSNNLPWRLLYGFWIISALFLGAVISCTFKTDLYSKYLTIDNFEDWRSKFNTPMWVMQSNGVSVIFMNFVSSFDKNNLTSRIRMGEPSEIVDPELWAEVQAGNLSLTADEWFLRQLFFMITSEEISRDKVYISNPGDDPISFVLSYSDKPTRDGDLLEIINIAACILFETKPFDYISLASSYTFNKAKWYKPLQEIAPITFKDTALAFWLLSRCYMFCGFSILLELLLPFFIKLYFSGR